MTRRTTGLQAIPWAAFGLTLCLMLGDSSAWDDGRPLPAPRLASAARLPAAVSPQQTPIIDPLPVLRPAFLPLAMRGYDPRLPEPLSSTLRGYLHVLRPLGRERCAPATHVLLDKPEGTLGAEALAVLHSHRPGPNLDFYAGASVELRGPQSLAPPDCRILTEWLIDVTAIKVIELPPG